MPTIPRTRPAQFSPDALRSLPPGDRLRQALPGLALSVAVGIAAVAVSRMLPAASAALVAILLGAGAQAAGLLPPVLAPGLAAASRTVLRAGIILLGFQLALGDVIALGPAVLGLIVGVVGIGIGSGVLLGRLLRVPMPLTILISCGFSICGAAAVAAASGALASAGTPRRDDAGRSDHGERLETHTATAIALVVVFGTLMIPGIPLAAAALDLAPDAAGTWAGASILEVAQVVAAGSLLGGHALDAAVLVKLGRVLLLAPVIAVLTLSLRDRGRPRPEAASSAGAARPPLVPMFVLGFLAAMVLRSTGIVPGAVLDALQLVQAVLLAAAMFALGTGVRIALLRQVGGRPVLLALLLGLIVVAAGLIGVLIIP